MSDAGLLPPSRARRRRARRAGHRARAPLLRTGVTLVLLGVVLPAVGEATQGAWGQLFTHASPGRNAWGGAVLVWLPAVAAAVVAVVAGLLVGGGVAWRNPGALRRLGLRRSEILLGLQMALLVVATAVGLYALRGLPAGAARAVDASPEGLAVLWWTWAVRGLTSIGAVLIAVGVVERIAAGRAALGALKQTARQRADEARR